MTLNKLNNQILLDDIDFIGVKKKNLEELLN